MNIVLKKNWGSREPVEKVYAYDPSFGVVLAKFAAVYGNTAFIEQCRPSELEAVQDDEAGTLHNVDTKLREVAEEIVNDD